MNTEKRCLIGSLVWSAIVAVQTIAGTGVAEEYADTQRADIEVAAIRQQVRTVSGSYALIRSNIWNSAEVQNSVRQWSGDENEVSNVVLSISMVLATNPNWMDTLALMETNLWLLGKEMWCPYTWHRTPRSQIKKVLREGLHREELLRQVGYPVRQVHSSVGPRHIWKYTTTEGDTCTVMMGERVLEWAWSKEDVTVGWRGKETESILFHFGEWLKQEETSRHFGGPKSFRRPNEQP
jgi:hypothetical protein